MSDPCLSPSASSLALADLLSKVLSCPTRSACLSLLSRTKKAKGKEVISQKQRQSLCKLAGLEQDWIHCNQKISGNVEDLASLICGELYDPFIFYTRTLLQVNINSSTSHQEATVPLKWDKRKKFWSAWNDIKHFSWLPPRVNTYDATVHFIQEGSGTGVHVGNGVILTCAHVVDARDDKDGDEDMPHRVGRMKTVMFPSGQVFLAQCVAVCETADGTSDTAALRLTAVVSASAAPHTRTANTLTASAAISASSSPLLPFATLASTEPSTTTSLSEPLLFCIGNPSSIDLESLSKSNQTVNFSPATWHTSVGHLIDTHSSSSLSPTSSSSSRLLSHSCWTYWGHSGAPLFNEEGAVVSLHCSWNDLSGVQQGQRLEILKTTLRQLEENEDEILTASTRTKRVDKVITRRKRKMEESITIVDLT